MYLKKQWINNSLKFYSTQNTKFIVLQPILPSQKFRNLKILSTILQSPIV